MKNFESLDFENDLFSGEQKESLLIVKFKKDLLLGAMDLKAKDILMEYMDEAAREDQIKVMAILGYPEKSGEEEYMRFYRNVMEPGQSPNKIERLYNAVNQFIIKLKSIKKIVIHGDSGKIISLFMNVSLACDYRIISEDAEYENPYIKLGLIPKGGGVFFLSKLIGESKAFDLLLSDEPIKSSAAVSLGIADKVVPLEKLEEEVYKKAKYFAGKPKSTLYGIKQLINYNLNDLSQYLEYENQILRRILTRPDFLEKLQSRPQ